MASWTTTTHWPPDLLRVGHLTAVGLHELLDLATRMKADPRGWIDAFPGASLACFFGRPWSEAGLSVAAAAHRSVEDSSFRLGSRPRIARTPANSPAALQVAVHLAETPIYLVVAALLLVAAGFTLVGTVVDIVEGSNSRTISDIRRSSRSANASSPGS